MDPSKTAILHRMVMETHTCPYGVKSKWLLEKNALCAFFGSPLPAPGETIYIPALAVS